MPTRDEGHPEAPPSRPGQPLAGDGLPDLLPHRLRQPGMPREVIRRPRLDQLYDELFSQCSVVAVSAAPGAGKSVQAQLYGDHCGLPVAWVTLGSSQSSPSRLLAALDQAVADRRRAGAETVTRRAFQLEATLEETAALTAGSVAAAPALLVIDECEHLDSSPDAQLALETFLEYCPATLRVLLLTRTDLAGPLQRRMLDGRIRLVDNGRLLLTAQENDELAALLGVGEQQRARVFDATGGWMAGSVFGYRYGLHEQNVSNDLPSAIMSEVLSQLSVDEQQFLLDGSVPDVLTREVAVALCDDRAHSLWDSVRGRSLPATTTTETTIVFHSLFRSFLHRQQLARDPRRHLDLVRRYARYLLARGHAEESTELYLSIGDTAQALTTAETAAAELCARSDWDTVLRWADRLGHQEMQRSPRLLAALVRSLFGRRRFTETVTLIRRLDRWGQLRAAMEADPALLATAAWALQSAPAEARLLLARYSGDYRADVLRFMLKVCTELTPTVPPLGSDWGDVERIMSWGLLLQGRIAELRSLAPRDPGMAVVNPNVILASIFAGEIDQARSLWNRVPQEIQDRPQSHFIEALLLLAEDEPDAALSAIEIALSDSRKTSFFLFPAYEVLSGYVLLRLGRHDDAVAALQDAIERTASSGQIALLEWGQAFLGFAWLCTGDAEAARPLLNECVQSMNRAHRRLFLPSAAAYLSEAEARCGDLEAAHAAADLAYHTSALMGSFSPLLAPLRTFPGIAKREEARDPTGIRWRRLVIAPSARPRRQPAVVGTVRIVLQPFGAERDIWVNGTPQKIGRMKIIELMALLALHPDGIDRTRLQNLLFPDATLRNGGNHFRQICFKFRKITGLSLDRREGNLVGLPADTIVDAADIRFEDLLRTASWVTDGERVLRLRAALELVRGPYLGGSDLNWAEERRQHLEVVQEEARLELVRLLVELGKPQEAREECKTLLQLNCYSDPGYRLLVQIERLIGSESSVLAAYRRAIVALQELGLAPGDARRLMALPSPPPRGPAAASGATSRDLVRG